MILALAAAVRVGGVALLDAESGLAAGRDLGAPGRHSEALIPAVEALLGEAGRGWNEITAVAVEVGPGSFTGIRVGLAAALGFAESGAIPAAGVGSLDIEVRACYHATRLPVGSYVISAVDVRRGEVALARFRWEEAGPVVEVAESLVPVADPGFEAPPEAWLAGDGAALLWPERSDLRRWSGTGAQRALAAARLGGEALERGDPAPAEPRYLRPADARRRGA